MKSLGAAGIVALAGCSGGGGAVMVVTAVAVTVMATTVATAPAMAGMSFQSSMNELSYRESDHQCRLNCIGY